MASRPLLDGPVRVIADDSDKLKRENVRLQRELDDVRLDLQKAKNEARHALSALSNLRTQLSPLHRALKQVFGELETVNLDDDPAPGTIPPAPGVVPDRFEAIKRQLGGKQAEIINAIQTFGPSTRTQLRASTGGAMSTIDTAIYSLRDKGVLLKQGDAWSLKGA